ncbi:MAG: CDP-diacylglycerol--glycerol-3-phosphate 3-phosphatidyltransferase [Planctomycetota bacterium]|nr:CDP-diacylglycerol--glycerol-3-phosphate 3-phosphatidyltransferase [Planctomycetota bacterium]
MTAPSAGARALIPNLLTVSRLFLAAAFIAILSAAPVFVLNDGVPATNTAALVAALILFLVAAGTDALDGYLARRWRVVSVFGRIMDPFADKLLVLGAFILLASPAFQMEGGQASGVHAGMAIVILARELLVTSIRAAVEGAGGEFGASLSGKAKMILQSLVVPLVLLLIAISDPAELREGWPRVTIDVAVWVTIVVTVISGWPYVVRGAAVLGRS